MWNQVYSEKDIIKLMKMFNNFHDSCIKEISYISGAYVNNDLSMNPINSKRSLKVIFNRQEENPIAIEVEFLNLVKMNLVPYNESYTCEIDNASFYYKEKLLYWVDTSNISNLDQYNGTWICAEKARWRIAD